MSNVEPVGNLYEIELLDTSKTASGLVLAGSESPYVLARIVKVPIRRRTNAQGFFPTISCQAGEQILIARSNIVHVKVGIVDVLLTSDESIIGIVS